MLHSGFTFPTADENVLNCQSSYCSAGQHILWRLKIPREKSEDLMIDFIGVASHLFVSAF